MISFVRARAKLQALLNKGALPASQCGPSFRKYISALLDTEVLVWKRIGGGSRLVVSDQVALQAYVRERFPDPALPEKPGSRVMGVAHFRDTKALRNDSAEIVSLRVWRDEALLKNGEPAGARAATAAHGMFSFPLSDECHYELQGKCALVENPAIFGAFEKLHLNVDAVIYGHGRVSNRTIDWLANAAGKNLRLLHLPDYDPVGLSEFQRLHSKLGDCVTLHLPSDLEQRFSRFSKRMLLGNRNSQAMLARLRKSELAEIRRVVGLIDRHAAGLEQEALLI